MVESIRDVMKRVLFVHFTCCTAIIASGLKSLPAYLDTISFNLFIAFLPVAAELFSIIIFCSYADEITRNVANIGHLFYNLLWNEMNVREQQLIKLAIQRSQKLIRVNDCSCERLLKVRQMSSLSKNRIYSFTSIFPRSH